MSGYQLLPSRVPWPPPYAPPRTCSRYVGSSVADVLLLTVILSQSRIMSASGSESKSTMQMIRTSMRNEGAMFMFKGWVPAWTRLQPTTMLIFITFEQLKRAVDWTRGDL